jgi:hypothetical protein
MESEPNLEPPSTAWMTSRTGSATNHSRGIRAGNTPFGSVCIGGVKKGFRRWDEAESREHDGRQENEVKRIGDGGTGKTFREREIHSHAPG